MLTKKPSAKIHSSYLSSDDEQQQQPHQQPIDAISSSSNVDAPMSQQRHLMDRGFHRIDNREDEARRKQEQLNDERSSRRKLTLSQRRQQQSTHSYTKGSSLSQFKKSFDEFEKKIISSPPSAMSMVSFRSKQLNRSQSSKRSLTSDDWLQQRQPSLSLLHSFAKTSGISFRSPLETAITSIEEETRSSNQSSKNLVTKQPSRRWGVDRYEERRSGEEDDDEEKGFKRVEYNDDRDEEETEEIPSVSFKLREQAFYDTIQPQFHFNVFVFQILIHLIPPLLFLFSPNRYAQGIRLNHWKSIRFNIMNPLFFYMMIISFFFLSTSDKEIVGHCFYIPAMFFVVHRIALGWKYATMSPTEYHRMMSCHDEQLVDSYIYQSELLSGWIQLDDLVLTFELGAASARIGNRLNETYFHISVPKNAIATLNNNNKSSATPHHPHHHFHHSALKSPSGVSDGDNDRLLQLFAWNEFLKGSSFFAEDSQQDLSTGTSDDDSSEQLEEDVKMVVEEKERDQVAKKLPIKSTLPSSSKMTSSSSLPFPLVKEIQRLPSVVSKKESGVDANNEIHFVVSVFDVCKALIRRANNENNLALYVVAFGVFGTMLLMILLLIIPVLKQLKKVHSTVAITLFLISSTALIWDYGRAYFFFIYVSLVDVSRYLKMMQMLHHMVRLTDLVMMKSASFSASPISPKVEESSKKKNAETVSSSMKKTSKKNYEDPDIESNLNGSVQVDPELEQEKEIMSAAEQHMMAIFDLCESGDLRRSVLVKRRQSLQLNAGTFSAQQNVQNTFSMNTNDHDDCENKKKYDHTILECCSSEDRDLAERVYDCHVVVPPKEMVSSTKAAPPIPGRLQNSPGLVTSGPAMQSNDKNPPTSPSSTVVDYYMSVLNHWKVIVPRLDLQPQSMNTNDENSVFANSDNITAWMLTRLAIQHFGERFRFRTDGYLVFTGLLTGASMVLALIAISNATDRKDAYSSILFLQSVLSITLFIVIFVLVLAIGMAVNVELGAQCRTLGLHVVAIKDSLRRNYLSSLLSLPYFSTSTYSLSQYLDGSCPPQVSSSKEGMSSRKQQIMDSLLSIERVMRTANLYNQLKPYKVFGLTARGPLIVSILTMSLSFYSVVFSMYSSSLALASITEMFNSK